MSRLFSEKDVKVKDEPQVVRLPPALWEQLTTIAEWETARQREKEPKAQVISRNDVIKRALANLASGHDALLEPRKNGKRGH